MSAKRYDRYRSFRPARVSAGCCHEDRGRGPLLCFFAAVSASPHPALSLCGSERRPRRHGRDSWSKVKRKARAQLHGPRIHRSEESARASPARRESRVYIFIRIFRPNARALSLGAGAPLGMCRVPCGPNGELSSERESNPDIFLRHFSPWLPLRVLGLCPSPPLDEHGIRRAK